MAVRPFSGCGVAVFCLRAIVMLCVLVSAERVSKEKCELCKTISRNFNEGLKRTAKANFGGGNTHWEEKSLGSFATSETRFIDITDHGVCDSDKDCHLLFEKHEESLEHWWFNVFAKDQKSDLFTWFCIDKIMVCCHNNTYGENCEACPGGVDRPCKGNGVCDGEGTRSGEGKCDCNSGYKGELCDDCVDGYYEESKNETHTSCQLCHMSCKSTCWEAGPKGCDECKTGWQQAEQEGCQDVNECESETPPCSETEFCTNSDGSFICTKCHSACDKCLGDGADKCVKCALGYAMDDAKCTDIDECASGDVCTGSHQSCVNSEGSYRCECEDGYEMNEEDDECILKPPEPAANEKEGGESKDSMEPAENVENIKGKKTPQGRQTAQRSVKKRSKKQSAKPSSTSNSTKKSKKKRKKLVDLRVESIKYYISIVAFALLGKLIRGDMRVMPILSVLYFMFIYNHCSQFDKLSNLKPL